MCEQHEPRHEPPELRDMQQFRPNFPNALTDPNTVIEGEKMVNRRRNHSHNIMPFLRLFLKVYTHNATLLFSIYKQLQ